jgi:FAD/FMN-containing dehydrogenase
LIDLSAMKGVHVDPTARTVRAQAGAAWGDVDRATQLFGLVTPGGEVSQTGIAGFTLGGGMGLLMRAYGLGCDNLRSIEIVTADGTVRTASREEHPDLFWAARCGGRGLGVVTAFEFDLHPLGPQVATAQVLYPYIEAAQVLRAWRDLTPQLPDTVAPEFVLWSIPPDAEIPAEMHGSKVVMVAGVYAGAPADATAALAPLAELGTPLMDLSATVSYRDVQSALDAAFPAGGRYFFKSHFADTLTDQAIDAMLACDADRPNPESLWASGPSAGRSHGWPMTTAPTRTAAPGTTSVSTPPGPMPRRTTPPSAGRARPGTPWRQLRRARRRGRPQRGVRAERRAPRPHPEGPRPRRHLRRRRAPALSWHAGRRSRAGTPIYHRPAPEPASRAAQTSTAAVPRQRRLS